MARAKAKGRGTPARAVLAGGISSSAMRMMESERAPDLSADEIAEAVVRGSLDPNDGPALSPTVEEMLQEIQQDWTVSVSSLGKRHWNIRIRSARVNAPIEKHDLDATSLREGVARAYAIATGER